MMLVAKGCATYSPVHAISGHVGRLDKDTCESIIQVNEQALLASDAVLANLDGKSFGTPLEIKLAVESRIDVFGFGKEFNSIYQHMITTVYSSLDDAISNMLMAVGNE
jgi:nucleoside 2-deoxyribosyltransferase